jgi:hypothetical protein
MKIAIMQPYIFPYLGYFQLINAVDKFILYDDVNYIKGGWINRNQILMSGKKNYFTFELKDSSSFKKINQILVVGRVDKLLKTIKQAYSKAPYFDVVFPIIEKIFSNITPNSLISEIAEISIKEISMYFNIKTKFELSSNKYSETIDLQKEERILKICKINNAKTYINAIGGKDLYDKKHFLDNKVNLYFIKSKLSQYKQFKNDFVNNLSVIDVMMFNSLIQIQKMLGDYEII